MAEFLLEIGLEEVPARMLASAERELGERVHALLVRERLCAESAPVRTFSTPRRLAVIAGEVAVRQPDAEHALMGPAWNVAFRDGAPTPAAVAFAKKAGVAVEAIHKVATAKGEYAAATQLEQGQPATAVLEKLLPAEIAALAWPKPMYWRAGKPERFVRPVQWLLALLDTEVVPIEFAGVRASSATRGHRILHGAAPVPVASPGAYVEALRAAYVMAEVAERRHTIRKALDHVTRTVAGARWREDEPLVETVTHLTEWPSVLLGSFAPSFLALPDEVLVTVMRDHQKYFALEDSEGRLLPHFLTVLNTAPQDHAAEVIRHGNERVLRARFSDAQFFWDFDARTPFAERLNMLSAVTFHKDLGSYHEKTERNLGVARSLALAAAEHGAAVDLPALEQAVQLAKCDLTTELVKEFTELQGIVGGLYLRRGAAGDGTAERAAEAIYWQYMPASGTEAIPPTVEGQLLGLADRMATLADMFALGLAPSGSRDPYALRRGANAIIRILALGVTRLTIPDLMTTAGVTGENADAVAGFLRERLSFYLREAGGLPADVVSAVLAAGAVDVQGAEQRGAALAAVRGSDDLKAIAAAWKRAKNILRQAQEKGIAIAPVIETLLLSDAAEQSLWRELERLGPEIERLGQTGSYGVALERVAALRPGVDRFFESVMVMVDDPALRANRLALMAMLLHTAGGIADFSEIVPAVVAET